MFHDTMLEETQHYQKDGIAHMTLVCLKRSHWFRRTACSPYKGRYTWLHPDKPSASGRSWCSKSIYQLMEDAPGSISRKNRIYRVLYRLLSISFIYFEWQFLRPPCSADIQPERKQPASNPLPSRPWAWVNTAASNIFSFVCVFSQFSIMLSSLLLPCFWTHYIMVSNSLAVCLITNATGCKS